MKEEEEMAVVILTVSLGRGGYERVAMVSGNNGRRDIVDGSRRSTATGA